MKTIVVFRIFEGEVLALFPEEPADVNGRYCMSYGHIGQHGTADYTHCVNQGRAATPQEYAELKKELEQRGYDFDVRTRISAPTHRKRQLKALKNWS